MAKHENHFMQLYNFEYEFDKSIEELEREVDLQSKEEELNSCVEFISQLVDLMKHTIIIPELQSKHDWDDGHEHQLKRNKGSSGNSLLDDRVQLIVMEKGLSTEQWKRLLYLNFTAGDTLEMISVSRAHLKKVHDMAVRLLEGEEKETALVLIDAITKYMPEEYYID
ncbi:unnamed protein product [Adineta ricciae]|uniref:Uncharacterized protein n=1 Tax=Adineta ricciae TaxID=249248 RepID=A0A815HUD7_ADIRI|nr:unnamed protein product [Adineta ricciae]CAF1359741.1 unnamed protein product [Adineta ricciae]